MGMGAPELAMEPPVSVLFWLGVAVALLLSIWLVVRGAVRGAVRSAFREQVRLAPPPPTAYPASTSGGEALPGAPLSPSLVVSPVAPNPYAAPTPALTSSVVALPPPRTSDAIFGQAPPDVMSDQTSRRGLRPVTDGRPPVGSPHGTTQDATTANMHAPTAPPAPQTHGPTRAHAPEPRDALPHLVRSIPPGSHASIAPFSAPEPPLASPDEPEQLPPPRRGRHA